MMDRPRVLRLLAFASVVIGLGLFVLIGTFDIESPGLYYDEALFVNGASGCATNLFVYGRVARIPIMLMPYIGALKAWIYAPIFELFGISFLTIRVPAVLLGALALALLWRYVRNQFGRLAATLFLAMAVVEPGTLFHSRLDWGPTVLMMLFRGGLLLALSRWFSTGERRYLMWALVCAGLGLFDKLNFVWFVVAMIAAGVAVYPERFVRNRRIDRRTVLVWLGLCIPALLAFVVALSILGINLLNEVGIVDAGQRFAGFVDLLRMTIRGSGVYAVVVQGEPQLFQLHARALAGVSVVALCGLIVGLRRRTVPARDLAYLALVMLFLSIQIFLTRRATGPHHFATFAPMWLIFIATGLGGVMDALRERSRAVAAAVGCLSVALVMASSLRVDLAYLDAFRHARLHPFWDPASSSVVTAALEARRDVTTVVTVDWGIATNVQALSNNRLRVIELWSVFNDELSDESVTRIRSEYVDGGAAFVVHVEGREAFPDTRRRFLETMRANRWPLRRIMTIDTADGAPYIEVYLRELALP